MNGFGNLIGYYCSGSSQISCPETGACTGYATSLAPGTFLGIHWYKSQKRVNEVKCENRLTLVTVIVLLILLILQKSCCESSLSKNVESIFKPLIKFHFLQDPSPRALVCALRTMLLGVENRSTSPCFPLALCECWYLRYLLFLLERDRVSPRPEPSSCWLTPPQSKCAQKKCPWYQLSDFFPCISQKTDIQQFVLLNAMDCTMVSTATDKIFYICAWTLRQCQHFSHLISQLSVGIWKHLGSLPLKKTKTYFFSEVHTFRLLSTLDHRHTQ